MTDSEDWNGMEEKKGVEWIEYVLRRMFQGTSASPNKNCNAMVAPYCA